MWLFCLFSCYNVSEMNTWYETMALHGYKLVEGNYFADHYKRTQAQKLKFSVIPKGYYEKLEASSLPKNWAFITENRNYYIYATEIIDSSELLPIKKEDGSYFVLNILSLFAYPAILLFLCKEIVNNSGQSQFIWNSISIILCAGFTYSSIKMMIEIKKIKSNINFPYSLGKFVFNTVCNIVVNIAQLILIVSLSLFLFK